MTSADKANAGAIFRQFPKYRQPLPDECLSIFDVEYLANRTAGGLGNNIARALESWMHKKAAASAVAQSEVILELGACSLNHLSWEGGYASYDVVEPFQKFLDTSSNLGLVRHTYAQLSDIPYGAQYDPIELICINDGSRDRTLPALEFAKKRYPAITIIDFTHNFHKEAALTAGLEFAAEDAVIITDSELQHRPGLIPEFIRKWHTGVLVVLAKRNSRSTESVLYRLLAGVLYRLHNNISSIKIPTNTGDFRLIDRQVCDAMKRLLESHRFMKGLFAWVGYEYELVEYDVAPRAHGRTSFNKWKSLNFALEGITGFSTVPLRVWTYAGLLVTAVGFFYACWVLLRAFFFGIDTSGYVTLLTTIVFFGGLQLIGIGVLGVNIWVVSTSRPRIGPYISSRRSLNHNYTG